MKPKDIITNPAFCPMPWTGLMYNFDGSVKNCIRSANTLGNIKNAPIEQVMQSLPNLARQALIVDNKKPSNCKPCHDLEQGKKSFDIVSDRVFYIRELKKVPLDTYRTNNFDLRTVDIRWTNLCNFSCVYCGPEFSSKWASELNLTPDTPSQQQQDAFKQYIFDHAKQLEHVYLAGGEPLLMKENLELLNRLKPDTNLRINTNLSKIDTHVFERICKFKNVHWTVSVETVESEFEYVRYGGRWSDFLENLNKISGLNHKISFNMLHFLLNYNSIFNCVDFLQQLGFHNNSFVIGALITPEYLNIRHLPQTVLNSVKSKLQNRINQNPGYLLEDSYRNMLHYIDIPFEKNIQQSIDQLSQLDQRRGINSKAIFKDFYKDINHGQTI